MCKNFILKIILLIIFIDNGKSNLVTLPKPTGGYSVGTKAIEMNDANRVMLRNFHSRRWILQAFYPSEIHLGTYSYMPNTLIDGIVEEIKVLCYAKPEAKPYLNQKFLLIIFIPGLGQERQKYTILCEELASQGYVVLSINQPYVSNFVKFSDGTKFVLTLKDVWKISRDRDYRYQYYDQAMIEVIQDIKYIVSHLKNIEQELIDNILDAQNIILMGHSFGGNVAHTLGFQDRRFKTIVDIDSKITERAVLGIKGVPANTDSKPVFFIRSAMQYQDDVGSQLMNIAHATIWQPNVQHSAFSDNAYLASQIPNFGQHNKIYQIIYWFFERGPYFNDVDTYLCEKNSQQWFDECRQFIVSWLKKQNLEKINHSRT